MAVRTCLRIFLFCLMISKVTGLPFPQIALEGGKHFARIQREALIQKLLTEDLYGIAKNVIVFIVDGMGLPLVAASRIYKGQMKGNPGEETMLSFEKFPNIGLMKTYCVDSQVGDSSCTATGIMTGVGGLFKTVGIDAHGKHGDCHATLKVKRHFPTSIMTHAQNAGKGTGVVTTTRITHATPAASYAHAADRDWESDADMPDNARSCEDIAMQLIHQSPGKKLDIIFGGGSNKFLPTDAGGQRKDGRNLVDEWMQSKSKMGRSARYVTNKHELLTAVQDHPQHILGLFNKDHMQYEADRNGTPANGEPHLSEMTSAALELLGGHRNGFVLMVEGGRVDHALHTNNAKRAIIELLAVEQAIEAALAQTNRNETLIIVTADHSHVMTFNGYPERGNPILGIAEVQDEYELPYTTLMFMNGASYHYQNNGTHIQWKNLTNVDTQDINFMQHSGIYMPSGKETHGGEDIPAYAIGPWGHLLNGVHHLPYLGHLTQFSACIGEYLDDCEERVSSQETKSFAPTKLKWKIMPAHEGFPVM